ncbi:MAG: PAS domain S-box protein [Nitrospinae bacterium]|nr:PAS domain S-box protein [Nitrospinota bacterium]
MKQEAEIQQETDIFQKAIDLAKENQRLAQEREQAEEQLKRANRQNELILSSAGEGIYGLDLEGNTTFTNPAAEKMLGYTEEELLGKPQHALIHHSKPDGSPYPREDCHIYAAFKDGKVHRESEEVFWRKDGTCFPVEYVSTPIIENAKLIGAVVTFTDITERKNLEKKLWSNEQRFRAISESSPVGIFQIDGDDFYIYFNTRWQVITKRTMKDSLGHKWWEIIHPGDKELVFEYWAKCEKGKETFSLDCRILRPDGEVVRCQIKASFFYDDYGKTTIGTIEEISARR